jgi:hypothetical protein
VDLPVAWPAERRTLVTSLALIVGWTLVMGVILWRFPPAGDDAYPHAVFGIEQLHCWRGGVAWPRFHPDWNGGTGSFWPAVYSPVALTVQGTATLLTGEGTRAVALSLLLAAIGGALLLRSAVRSSHVQWWLWLALPYLLVNIFARATVTEMWALAATAGILALALPPGPPRTRDGFGLVLLAALAAGSQPMMLLILGLPLAAAWIASVPIRRLSTWKNGAAWGTAALLVAAIFWLPAWIQLHLFDRKGLFGGQYVWRDHFATSVAGNSKLGPVLLAIWLAMVVIAASGAILLRRHDSSGTRAEVAFLAACVVLASPLSAPLWRVSGLGIVQFPWRFLGPASVVAIFLVSRFPRRLAQVLGAVLILPALLVPIDVDGGFPPLSADLTGRSLAVACSVRYGIAPILGSTPGEYSAGFDVLESLQAVGRQSAMVKMRGGSCCRRAYSVVAKAPGRVLLPVQWWPEWKVRVDGRARSFVNREGFVALTMRAGPHAVDLELGPPRARRKGIAVAVAGLLVVALLWLRGRRDQLDVPAPGSPRDA